MIDEGAFVTAQSRLLERLCIALDGDEWTEAARLAAELEEGMQQAPAGQLPPTALEALGTRHAAYLRALVAARQRLEETSERMSGVRRAMQAYAHLNDQD